MMKDNNQAILKMLTDNQLRLEKNLEKIEEGQEMMRETLNKFVTHMELNVKYYDDFKEFKKSVKADIDYLKKPKDGNGCSFGVLIEEKVKTNKEDIEELKAQGRWFSRLFVGGFISGAIASVFFLAKG